MDIPAKPLPIWEDKEAFREVARLVRPDMEDEEFERLWDEHQRDKRRRSLH